VLKARAIDLSRAVGLATLLVLASLSAGGAARAAKPANGAVAFSALRSDTRVLYTKENDATGLQRVRVDGLADHPAVSPGGRRVAFTKYGPWGAQVWVSYLDGAGIRALTTGSTDTMPAWSPDGTNVVYASGRKGRRDIYRVIADGTRLRRLTYSPQNDEQPAWSSTGVIAFVRRGPDGNDIYTVSANGGSVRRLTTFRDDDLYPAWSPTGRTLVFSRGRKGRRDLFVVTADGSKVRRLTRVPGDETEPTFSPDGTRVAFVHRFEGEQRVYILKVKGKAVTRLPARSLRVRRMTTARSAARAPSWAPTGLEPVVAAAGDIACGPNDSAFNYGEGQVGVCRQRLTSDLLMRMDLSAVLTPGDIQYPIGAYDAFQQSFHPSWGRVKELIRPVPGNHEYETPGAAGYFDYFNGPGAQNGLAGERGKGYYSFDVGSWHLIALNSSCHEVGGCDADSPQGRWLAADLAAHPTSCTLAYWHYPRFTSGRYGDGARDVRPFWESLQQAGAELVLSGHEHFYERFAPQDVDGTADPARGIRQLTVGMGGRSHHGFITVAPNSEVRNSATVGVVELTLGEGRYDWRLVRAIDGATMDQGTQFCH
jgi:hypothetical protein